MAVGACARRVSRTIPSASTLSEQSSPSYFHRRGRRLVLLSDGETIASAVRRPPLVGRRFLIGHLGDTWTLERHSKSGFLEGRILRGSQREGSLVGRYVLTAGDWKSVASRRGGALRRRAEAEIRGEINVAAHVPVPVTALAMRLTFDAWIGRLPKIGTWEEWLDTSIDSG